MQSASRETLRILRNKEVIDVNQDPLGVQGRKIRSVNGLEVRFQQKCYNSSSTLCTKRLKINVMKVWGGPLSRKRVVVVLWNRSNFRAAISARWREIGLVPSTSVTIRDLWTVKTYFSIHYFHFLSDCC